jgi:hypothetical protein
MSTNRSVYHVVTDGSCERWLVTQEKDDTLREEHAPKTTRCARRRPGRARRSGRR